MRYKFITIEGNIGAGKTTLASLLAEEYGGHGKTLASQGQASAKGAHDQDSLKSAETDLRVCLF